MLIVTGSIAYDFIIDFPGKFADHILPDQIHKLNLSFNVDTYAKRRGGTAANLCYSLALLGTKSILFGAAGKDFVDYKKFLKKLGVDTSSVLVNKKEYTSTGFGITDSTNNQIWGYSYGAGVSALTMQLSSVTRQNDLVIIGPQNAKATMRFVRECIALQVPYLFDPSFTLTELSDADLAFGISHAAYLIANDYEMILMQERLKKEWNTITKDKMLITTLGEKGARIVYKDKIYTIAIAKPKKFIDPTGAGDAWRAGFLAGLERGYDLQTCGQMGAVAATYAIEKYGTQEHIYTPKQFETRYRQNFGSLIKL